MFEQELNKYWKTVVDTIQDGIMIVDTKGTIVSVNRAFETITGHSITEIIGKPCTILNCNACELVRGNIGKGPHWCGLFKKGKLRMQKCVMTRKNGDHIHVVKNASVLLDSKGNITGAVETITDITDLIEKETQIETFRRELEAEDRFHGILGTSAPMQQVFNMITNASESDAPVIIFGESGTGKELVARAIHKSGPRKTKPYVKVSCAALNESLLESELFGHVKGAYTGAFQSRTGRFEAAHKGDIFLDEIGDLPLSTQVKLLRVLEEKIIERVGDHRPIRIDVRIITATNKDLKQLVDQGVFREDFYYRINVLPIWIPPLRERTGDIQLLAESFFQRICLKSEKRIQGITNEALDFMIQYPWPGNVRELKSTLEYAFVACQGSMIGPEHLPPNILHMENPHKTSEPSSVGLDEIKKQRLIDALQQSGGNQSEAARILGISRTSVWSQIKKYGIKPARELAG
ncbi:MAG: sigma-54-dependent Fis family transcriptional regulator [Desulfobacterales bacterium S5133MH16]|nr:MAG: sigma-54-dependent Fis family transcriptional regulator [Desulfobacterales bacterium S5133MH16]